MSLIAFVLSCYLSCYSVRSNIIYAEYMWMSEALESLVETYLPYEICLVKLDKLDYNSSFINQSTCNTSKTEYPPTYLPEQTTGEKGLFPACTLGFTNFRLDGGLNAGETAFHGDDYSQTCSARKISQRKGLRSVWTSLEASATPNSYKSTPLALTKLLKQHFISNIIFIGDSVATQVGKFFGCDMSRTSGVQTIKSHLLLDYYKSRKREQDIQNQWGIFEYEGHTVKVSAIQPIVDCLYKEKGVLNDNCKTLEDRKRSVYRSTMQSLLNAVTSATKESPYIIIFNKGLHISKQNSEWQLQPALQALLEFAKTAEGRYYVFFRETSSQHFVENLGGDYDSEVDPIAQQSSLMNNNFCCGKETYHYNLSKDSYEYNWRNKRVSNALSNLDRHWVRHIGWIPFFEITSVLHDMHVEITRYNIRDCTHYLYAPYLFSPLWNEMLKAFKKTLPLSPDTQQQSQSQSNPEVSETNTVINMFSEKVRDPSTVSLENGKVYLGPDKKIYLIDEGTKRPFQNMAIFQALGHNENELETISESHFNELPEGVPVS